MELYPRIGKHFDIKTWTNCRVGMMGWGILILCYAVKQYEEAGFLSDSMAVSVLLMHVYIAKFFWYGYLSPLPTVFEAEMTSWRPYPREFQSSVFL
jgi:7-dehydrocholesterol reductase